MLAVEAFKKLAAESDDLLLRFSYDMVVKKPAVERFRTCGYFESDVGISEPAWKACL